MKIELWQYHIEPHGECSDHLCKELPMNEASVAEIDDWLAYSCDCKHDESVGNFVIVGKRSYDCSTLERRAAIADCLRIIQDGE